MDLLRGDPSTAADNNEAEPANRQGGQDGAEDTHKCSKCARLITVSSKSSVCENFILCANYKAEDDRAHEMAGPEEREELKRRRYLLNLVHASRCRKARCRLSSCRKLKPVVRHIKTCGKRTADCQLRRQLVSLCRRHARLCQDANCSLPLCYRTKMKIGPQQPGVSLRQLELLARSENRAARPRRPSRNS